MEGGLFKAKRPSHLDLDQNSKNLLILPKAVPYCLTPTKEEEESMYKHYRNYLKDQQNLFSYRRNSAGISPNSSSIDLALISKSPAKIIPARCQGGSQHVSNFLTNTNAQQQNGDGRILLSHRRCSQPITNLDSLEPSAVNRNLQLRNGSSYSITPIRETKSINLAMLYTPRQENGQLSLHRFLSPS